MTTTTPKTEQRDAEAILDPKPAEKAAVWGHAAHEDEEGYVGKFATREAVIADGRETYKDAAFYIISGEYPDVADAFDADDFLERAQLWAFENVGGEEDALEVSDMDAFKTALAQLVREHVTCTRWQSTGSAERIEAPELFVFTDDVTWVVARSAADACVVYDEFCGNPTSADADGFSELADDAPLGVWCDAKGDPGDINGTGCSLVKKACSEWIKRGRGFLASTEQ